MFETAKMCVHDVQWHMIPTQADGGDSFSSSPQSALGHSLFCLRHQNLWLALPKIAAAAADFRNERLLTAPRSHWAHQLGLFHQRSCA